MKFVVTGLPRSGTKYASEVLNTLGISCGHEEVFTPKGRVDSKDLIADSSWMAVPYLKELKEEGIKIIFIQRDIAKVIDSLIDLKFFDEDYNPSYRKQYRDFALKDINMPDAYNEKTKYGYALYWCLYWLENLYNYADITIDIENISNNLGIPKDLNNRNEEKTAISNSSL